MSAIARYLNSMGKNVSGYDRVRTSLCIDLENEGMIINYQDDLELIPKEVKQKDNVLIIYTPAIPKNSTQFNYFKNNDFTLFKR